MDTKQFLKWAVALAAILAGTIYIASAILVSEKVAGLFDFTRGERSSYRIEVVETELSVPTGTPDSAKDNAAPETSLPARKTTVIDRTSSRFSILALIPIVVGIIVFAGFIVVPVAILYVFLIRPLRDIPLVSSDLIAALGASDSRARRDAAVEVAIALLASDTLGEDERNGLQRAVERPTSIAEKVAASLEQRESAAKLKAIEIATMAGLTVAASSSAMGDGLGMLVWKSKLVYETFRIYGFRPDAKTTLSIWAHVVFASLFAASVEELCELLDVSSIIGGIGTRVVQGAVGAAVVLKGGHLTRAYLTGGITDDSRRKALLDFKSSAKTDLGEVGSSIINSLGKIGMEALS